MSVPAFTDISKASNDVSKANQAWKELSPTYFELEADFEPFDIAYQQGLLPLDEGCSWG